MSKNYIMSMLSHEVYKFLWTTTRRAPPLVDGVTWDTV